MGAADPRCGTEDRLIVPARSDVRCDLHRAIVDGIELHYVERGTGPPLVLLHGGTGDYRSWRPHAELFATRYRTIAYSRRHSFPNRNDEPVVDYSAVDDADDLLRLLDSLAIGAAHVVGASYGALVALTLAARAAERVRTLVLFEPPLHPWLAGTSRGRIACRRFHRQIWASAAAQFRARRDSAAMATLIDGFAGIPAFAAMTQARVQRVLDNATAMKALTLSTNPFPELPRDAVRSLGCPVLIAWGEHATAIHRLAIDELRSELPFSANLVIAGADHRGWVEQHRTFARAVLGWLDPCPATR